MRLASPVPFLASLILTPAAVWSQQPVDSSGPQATVRRFFGAVARQEWDHAAGFLDIGVFLGLREELMRHARTPPQLMTPEAWLATDSTMPRAVAEYQARRMAELHEMDPPALFPEFDGVESVEAFAAMSAVELAVAWLKANDFATHLLRFFDRNGCLAPPAFDTWRRERVVDILGAALPAPDTAFVLFYDQGRRPQGSPAAALRQMGPRTAHLTLQAGTWRILPRHDLMDRPQGFSVPQCRGRMR